MKTRNDNRVYLYIAFALIILMMSWESNLASAALMNGSIPEQSIRIRILANSDSVEDQWIKKEIRDAITANVKTWGLYSENIEDARNEVNAHLPELGELVHSLLAKYDYAYGYQMELGKVEFPTKIFGNITYPAGEYEALRITLGEGLGDNWWCVLFPPLCFGSAIKATAKDGVKLDKDSNRVDQVAKAIKTVKGNKLEDTKERLYQAPVQDGDDVKVKFFIWEKTKKLGGFINNVFGD